MLLAVLDDLRRIPTCRPVTTWANWLGLFPLADTVDVTPVDDSLAEEELFVRLAAESDTTLIVAPETDNILLQRIQLARAAGARVCGLDDQAIELTTDKLATAIMLQQHGIPTIPTIRPGDLGTLHAADPGCGFVLKRRDGAGSQQARYFASIAELDSGLCEMSERERFVVQPFVRGRAVSVAVIGDCDGRRTDVLPVADQWISDDGRFTYLGGRIPSAPGFEDRTAELTTIVRRAAALVAPVRGWCGFDLIVPDDPCSPPLLVEINPRLTTSYLGYRRLFRDNLAARMLGCGEAREAPLLTSGEAVAFRPSGHVESVGTMVPSGR